MSALIPASVERTIKLYFGDRGRDWLAALPAVRDRLLAKWELTVVGDALSGGTHSYVAPVRRADGLPAILKIPVTDEENIAEATALHLYGGDGAVLLYEFDPDSGALLLEHAVPGEPLVAQFVADTRLEGHPENIANVEFACALLRRLWRVPADAPDGFPRFPLVRDIVSAWSTAIPAVSARFDDFIPAALLAHAAQLCAEYRTPDGVEGIVNRDTHLGNIVSAQREPWLLIDPKPFLGERPFDAGYLLIIQLEHRPDATFATDVVGRTADGLGVAADRARGWGFLRSLEEAMWSTDDAGGPTSQTRRYLAIAEALRP